MRSLALILVVVAGCGADPTNAPAPDLRMQMAPTPCMNGFTDGDETDEDCGGSACTPCADGKSCKMGRDCANGVCTNGVCGAPSQCMNMKQDGNETDVDCGGDTCEACDDGKMCQQGTDCMSGTCTTNVCKRALMCMAGTADCDGNAGNGCELNTNTDAKNCGECGRVCPNNAPTCAAGKCQARVNVLLVGAADPRGLLDVQQKLMMTGAFTVVDTFDASAATPSVMQLQAYSTVLTWSEGSRYKDAATLGDNLATYFDGGGRVVVAMFAILDDPELVLQGRFGTVANGYLLIAPGRLVDSNDELGKIAEPASPLVAGVKTLTAGTAFATSGAVSNGGVVVASWSSQTPLIVRGKVKGRNRVDLNMYPVSMSVDNRFWSGDGAIIMRNALLYQ